MEQAFKGIVKSSVAPLLRGAGFTRRGLTFARPGGAYIQILSIQRSSFNHRERCTFTFNTGVFVSSVAATYYQSHAPKHPTESACLLRRRGGYIAGTHDLWFELTPSSDLSLLNAQVRAHVSDVLLPYLDSLRNPESFLAALSPLPADPQQQVFRAIFFVCEGQNERGASTLRSLLSGASNPVYRASLLSLCERLGLSQAVT
jgi:hypothetical protein